MEKIKRRELLGCLVGGIGLLSGCSGLMNEENDTPSTSPTPTSKSSPTEHGNPADTPTDTETLTETKNPDNSPPQISLDATPTQNAGEIAVTLDAQDETGLAEITTLLNGKAVAQESIGGRRKYSRKYALDSSETAALKAGHMTSVTVRITDTCSNTGEESVSTYARKYSKPSLENSDVRIGTQYWGGLHWEECMDPSVEVKPSVGKYDLKKDIGALNRHIDQIQGNGIDTMMVTYNGSSNSESIIRTLLSTDLAPAINMGTHYVLPNALRWNKDQDYTKVLKEDMRILRNTLYEHDSYEETSDGRPIVTLWGVNFLPWAETEEAKTIRDNVLDTWGGYSEFIDFFREELSKDGKEPYLIGDIDGGISKESLKLDRQFDAITHWPAPQGNMDWEEAYKSTRSVMELASEFATNEDIDFIPRVFPGFDDRHNTCWGQDRYIPRGTEHLQQLLGLAEEYRDTDRVLTIAYNDWTEGTQIEPGIFRGEDYGTSYLELLQNYAESPEIYRNQE